MATQDLNKSRTSSIEFQNRYVRCQVGAPVVPILKSIQLIKRPFCETCNDEYHGLKDKHVLTPQHQIFSADSPKKCDDLNKSCVITNENDTNIIPFPLYDPKKRYGEEMLLPVKGFFCMICDDIFIPDEKTYINHCKSKEHYDNYVEIYQEMKLNNLLEEDEKPLTVKTDSDRLNKNPLPIRIKIENTDTALNNSTNKKPLSERLGAVKKNNKALKRFKLQQKKFDGDINESMRQFLPKPSSHITPSRKVFVDDFNSNTRSNVWSSKVFVQWVY